MLDIMNYTAKTDPGSLFVCVGSFTAQSTNEVMLSRSVNSGTVPGQA